MIASILIEIEAGFENEIISHAKAQVTQRIDYEKLVFFSIHRSGFWRWDEIVFDEFFLLPIVHMRGPCLLRNWIFLYDVGCIFVVKCQKLEKGCSRF